MNPALANGPSPGALGAPALPTWPVCPVRPSCGAGTHLPGQENQADAPGCNCPCSESLD